jgi:hypothetical protein
MIAVEGIYDGITAKPSSKIVVDAGCPVIITFLDEKVSKSEKKSESGDEIVKFFETYGVWDDERDTETIIRDIRGSRMNKSDVKL